MGLLVGILKVIDEFLFCFVIDLVFKYDSCILIE